jgi:two-component system, NtrC family, sensor kinase
MIRLPFRLSIERKLTLLMLATTGIALVLAVGSIVILDGITERQQLNDHLKTQATLLAENTASSLVFKQYDFAEELLSILVDDPRITLGCLLDADQNIVAKVCPETLSEHLPSPEHIRPGLQSDHNFVKVTAPVILKTQVEGYVYLAGDLRVIRRDLVNSIGIGFLALSFAFVVAILVSSYLQSFVSVPILTLTSIAHQVIENKDYSLRAPKHSDDEIGQLMEIFNQMLTTIETREIELHNSQNELEARVKERTRRLSGAVDSLKLEIEARKKARIEVHELSSKLIETTRQAGMAEVASGVLHNVGNVLNHVNVSAGIISERLDNLELETFETVVKMLPTNVTDLEAFIRKDPRATKLPHYLAAFVQYLKAEQEKLRTEAENLAQNIEHIKSVIATQQRHTGGIGIATKVKVEEVIEEILDLHIDSLQKDGITVSSDFDETPAIVVDRNKLIQILGNLILNGREALQSAHHSNPQLTIATRVTAENLVAIQVRDNGIGINPSDLRWIFSHGFTTKSKGHGFGLHSSAIAAQEMAGRLRALSEGPGSGATFILELPIG